MTPEKRDKLMVLKKDEVPARTLLDMEISLLHVENSERILQFRNLT